MREGTLKVEDGGGRLDLFLAEQCVEFSRSQWKTAILDERVTVNGRPTKPNYRLRKEDVIEWTLPEETPNDLPDEPEEIPLDILFEDESILVLNKPAGLVVHPGAGNESGTLVNGLLFYDQVFESVERAGIVHRLDKDTSGVLVVAKTPLVQEELQRQFKQRETKKEYLALVWGTPPKRKRIETLLGRHPVHRQKMAVLKEEGRIAISTIEVLEQFAETALLSVRIETGRTHQIRVHVAHLGFPIVGDALYGRSRKNSSKIQASRQMLHAWRLEFLHPIHRKKLLFEAPLPNDMGSLLARLRTV